MAWLINKEKITTSKDLAYFVERMTLLESSHSRIVLDVFDGNNKDMKASIVVAPSNIKHLMLENHNKYIKGTDIIDKMLTRLLLECNRNLQINVSQGSFTQRLLSEDVPTYNQKITALISKFDTKFEFKYHNDLIDTIEFPEITSYDESKQIASTISRVLSDKLGISSQPVYTKAKTWQVRIYYGEEAK